MTTNENEQTPAPEQIPVPAEAPAPAASSTDTAPISQSIPEDSIPYDAQPVERVDIPVAQAPAPEERPKDRPEEYHGFEFPRGKNEHVATMEPVYRQVPVGKEVDEAHVAGLPCDVKTFNQLLDSYPSINYELDAPTRGWASEIQLGSSLMHQGSFLSKAVDRDGSLWAQRVAHGATSLGINRPRLGAQGGAGVHISGELASLRARQALGLGAAHNIPLWHSGFWVTLKAPSTAARLELQRRIDEEKITLGRRTDGLAYSNVSVYLQSYLTDFALAHLSTANVRYNQPLDLKDLVLSPDIPLLIWGLLTTMYPNGYAYHQPCVNDPSKCQHITKAILDLNKICFTDNQRLTEAQRAHMAKRGERMEPRDLEAYRKDHAYNGKGLIEVGTEHGKLKIQLKVPTITEYAGAGFSWVDGIANAIQQAFGTDLVGERRNQFILERAAATQMCEYSHWVKEIGFEDGTTIEDVETIRATLADISGEPKLTGEFFEAVAKFAEDCTLSLIALPRFDCPACGIKSTAEEKAHPYLMPIDVEALFFTMLDQLLEKVLT